jgi:hypothetical protein
MAVLRVGALPDEALAAAATFYGQVPPGISEDMVLIFPPADHTHRSWRLAAVQSLARENAPFRINALVGESEGAIAAAVAWLGSAGGVTGHLLELDDTGAGEVVSSPA